MKTEELNKTTCPHCGGHIEHLTEAAGHAIRCPHCGESVVLSGVAFPRPTATRTAEQGRGSIALARRKPPGAMLVVIFRLAGCFSFCGSVLVLVASVNGEVPHPALWFFSCLFTGLFLLGFAQIIDHLGEIRAEMESRPRGE